MKKIAIVRGANLNKWEMQNYEHLSDIYDITAYAASRTYFDISRIKFPVVQLPFQSQGLLLEMQGLENHFADKDIVFSADITYRFSAQAVQAKKKSGCKVVCLEWENIPFNYEEYDEVRNIKETVRSGADHFIAVTGRAKEALILEGVPEEKIDVIPMGIDLNRFMPDRMEALGYRKKLGIGDDEVTVLYIGRMVREKGVYDFVHAAGRILSDKSTGSIPVRFVMAGSGHEQAALRERADRLGVSDSIIFLENTPYQDIHKLHNAADIFVLPSISTINWQEQFGMVLIESMACGKPVISTLSGSIPEVVGDAGILVQPNDHLSLYEAMKQLIKDKAFRDEIGNKALARARAHFDSRKNAEKFRAVFEKVMSRKMSKKGFSEFEWEIKESGAGDMTLILGGRAVYSLYDPLKHAEITAHRLIEKVKEEGCDHIIIIGLGLGYLPSALYEAGFKRIVVWEPFPIMQESFSVCNGDWRRAVVVVNDRDEFEKAVVRFAGKGSRPKLIIHPGYDIFCRLEHRLAVQALDRIYNDSREEAYVISPRSLESLARLPFLGTVKEFEGLFTGRRAVLANPGPSLKQGVHILKGADDVIVFASLQSASYLQKNGIRVNYIVCADPKDMSPFTAECNDDFEAFFAETSINPVSLDWKKDKIFLFHFRCGQIHEMLWEQAQLPVIEDPTSSVSEVMLLLADYMGFDEIYCLGMDFCWKEDRYTYRTKYKCDNDTRINGMGSCFKLLTSDNQIATTQSLYFHGARFMKHKCAELKSKGKGVYQIEGGIDFTSTGILTVDGLEKKMHSGKEREAGSSVNRKSPVTVEQVENLLNHIKLGRINSRQTYSDAGKMWPFLQAIPAEEIPEACDRAINKLELHEAEATLRKVIELKPDDAFACSSLGNVLKRLERFEEAISFHKHAVSLMPTSAEARSNLASAYLAWGKIDSAIEEYRTAIDIQPDSAELYFNLGTALQKGEKFEDACASFRHSLKLNPDHVHAIMNLGTTLKAFGRLDEAIACLRRAIELSPDFADAHWNLALCLLAAGDYSGGWREYEWRLKIPDIPIRRFNQPIWDGSVQPDKTLLIHAEQGMGDVIQFIRYAALARARVGRVILDCHAPLTRLLSDTNGVDQVVSTGQPLPIFDMHLPLLSLPGGLGATLENIPSNIPYLHADAGLTEKWRAKVNSDKYRIGLVWAGNSRHRDDHNRSIKLSAFSSLLKIPEVTFYSLQKEKPGSQSIDVLEGVNLIDAGPELTDFADTAALIANLDMIISVDTAVAHLAGAMGKPVWLLLPFAPDWRWMLEREDTPWYPTMRLFRQSRPGDGDSVLEDVGQALKKNVPDLICIANDQRAKDRV